MDEPKQVIVMRRDLKMRRGKEIAQGAHASLKVFTNCRQYPISSEHRWVSKGTSEITEWLTNGRYKKVCVRVDSEEELLAVFNQAQEAGIPSALILDAGLTEFDGVPTYTCCAIGPDKSTLVDPITGHLKLL